MLGLKFILQIDLKPDIFDGLLPTEADRMIETISQHNIITAFVNVYHTD